MTSFNHFKINFSINKTNNYFNKKYDLLAVLKFVNIDDDYL
jgi:hypothetical protein